ncbi:hypothetical protein P43SY_010519 [Pythium insidiosum]|uniref:Transmembrane protein n=1 Tax=Pythium insidiosum TaxID=114742 RepID=A0AAD5Q1C3_PYTIN|nr:hypothetical protein P43SY_010519 [Pythium insidiosum]
MQEDPPLPTNNPHEKAECTGGPQSPVPANSPPSQRWKIWFSTIACFVSLVWNVSSPFKQWALSRYGLIASEVTVSRTVGWNTVLDPAYVEYLYDHAGVPLDRRGEPRMLINVFIDFMITPKATRWGHLLNDMANDQYAGRYCRAGLVPNVAAQLAAIQANFSNGVSLWNGMKMTDFVPDQATGCAVGEVTEAVLCLKGINASTLVNLEWSAGVDPQDPDVHDGLQAYQDLLFPDLAACLARRALLTARLGRDSGLLRLTAELAANYSLELGNVAGTGNLYATFRQEAGFVDISGRRSGERVTLMMGNVLDRSMNNLDGNNGVLVAARETLWWCVLSRPAQLPTLRACIEHYARALPAFQVGYYIRTPASSRYAENRVFSEPRALGNLTRFDYVGNLLGDVAFEHELLDTRSLVTGVYGRYKDIQGQTIAPIYNISDRTAIANGVFEHCLVADDCFEACQNQSADGSWTVAFRRSGVCEYKTIPPGLLNTRGFPSPRCFGAGTSDGAVQVTLKAGVIPPVVNTSRGPVSLHTYERAALPANIMACIIGGRVPRLQDDYLPTYFYDMVFAGANTVLTTSFTSGSELLLLNIYALVILVGSIYYSVCVARQHYRMLGRFIWSQWSRSTGTTLVVSTDVVSAKAEASRKTRFGSTTSSNRSRSATRHQSCTLRSLLFSLVEADLVAATWQRHYNPLRLLAALSLVTWYIGAVDTRCGWFLEDREITTDAIAQAIAELSPHYKCVAGSIHGPFRSTIEVARLLGISYNVFALTSLPHYVGVTGSPMGFVVAVGLLGLLPTLVWTTVITAINMGRLRSGALSVLHNHLVIGVLWLAALGIMGAPRVRQRLRRLTDRALSALHVTGFQRTKPQSVAWLLFGEHYPIRREDQQAEPTEWMPLRLLLEHPRFDLDSVNWITLTFNLYHERQRMSDSCKANTNNNVMVKAGNIVVPTGVMAPVWNEASPEVYLRGTPGEDLH